MNSRYEPELIQAFQEEYEDDMEMKALREKEELEERKWKAHDFIEFEKEYVDYYIDQPELIEVLSSLFDMIESMSRCVTHKLTSKTYNSKVKANPLRTSVVEQNYLCTPFEDHSFFEALAYAKAHGLKVSINIEDEKFEV